MIRDNIPRTIKGVGALVEALNCIGAQQPNGDNQTDHDLAKIIVDHEVELRELVRYALDALSGDT